MNTIHKNIRLRKALHSIYVAQFMAIKECPDGFSKADATRMLTALMSARPWSWRVIGITPDALMAFAENNFKRPTRQLQRGHRFDRASTADALYFKQKKPMPLKKFFDFFLERDKTVIMTNDENKHMANGKFPKFIKIDNRLELFPCGTLIGWKHRKAEVDFLRSLHLRSAKTKSKRAI